ncbi:MAG: protein arginine kinase [Planctomycetes bacterium]|nr:protein arginine kinase [Planctomycetota bacterium]
MSDARPPQPPQPPPPADVLPEWLKNEGDGPDVVLSSRVRLARNLAGQPFVSKASRKDRQCSLERCRDRALHAALAPRLIWYDLHLTPPLERAMLVERHLISKQLAKGRGGSSVTGEDPRGVAIALPDERLSIMVNEEDHLRIQAIRSGLALGEAWADCDAADDKMEAGLDLAYSQRFGYLTACPTNVGTGLRMSVMLHLPGLRVTGEIDKVKRAAADMCLAVRGFYGEGSEAIGDLFQLSNQTTMGKTEAAILRDMEREIVPRIVEYERASRKELLGRRRVGVEDQIMRAWGLLTHARLLATEEAMQALSLARLGVLMGIIRGRGNAPVDPRAINQLMLLVQPAHLQRAVGRELDQEQRRLARASLVRARLAVVG